MSDTAIMESGKSENQPPALLPDRHPQEELFICDVADAVLKDIMQHMEHPFFSLSKKPDTAIRRYEHKGNWLEITPSVKGLATIYDKDILIYAISQIMAKLKNGERVTQRVRINSHDLLIFTNRGTAGKDYTALVEAIDRLAGTRISTNIRAGEEEQYENFGLIEAGSVRRKNGLDGRLLWVEIKLSDWVFNAIRANEVLTLNRDYFRLRKPIERRIYEIARKHCGQQKEWRVSVEILHKKSGSRSSLKEFRRAIRHLVENDHLPDYTVSLDQEEDQVVFKNRSAWWENKLPPVIEPKIRDTETYEKAKRYVPRDQSVYEWEQDWIAFWKNSGCPPLQEPDKAFIGFCKGRFVKDKQGKLPI